MRWRASARVMGPQHSTSVIVRVMAKPSTARRARVAATTASTQDYLAAIYDLGGSGKPVIGARLAKHMSVSARSEEHTSELQSRPHLVCRLLLEKKKNTPPKDTLGGKITCVPGADADVPGIANRARG